MGLIKRFLRKMALKTTLLAMVLVSFVYLAPRIIEVYASFTIETLGMTPVFVVLPLFVGLFTFGQVPTWGSWRSDFEVFIWLGILVGVTVSTAATVSLFVALVYAMLWGSMAGLHYHPRVLTIISVPLTLGLVVFFVMFMNRVPEVSDASRLLFLCYSSTLLGGYLLRRSMVVAGRYIFGKVVEYGFYPG